MFVGSWARMGVDSRFGKGKNVDSTGEKAHQIKTHIGGSRRAPAPRIRLREYH